mmetsp:Transcript_6670/g.11678  ORF Transcript_6670/g.11678 Transcript_6670/m.11678 type:complete len:468 (+) Transcript_6670:94-1497(+)
MSVQASSALARKYELLQQRGKQRTPLSQGDRARPVTTKADIDNLKEYYLQRLAKSAPQAAGRLSSPSPALSNDRLANSSQGGGLAQLQARGQVQRPASLSAQPNGGQTPDVEELEVLCNNCFNLIKTSDAPHCTGDPKDCPIADRLGTGETPNKVNGQVAVLDLKLQKLRENITVRLASANTNSRVNIMRHLTQLRYHIDTAAKWAPGSPELGSLSDHTIQQVKQLTQMARVLEPAIYVFSKRIENVILQKERELRKVGTAKPAAESEQRVTLRYERPDIGTPVQLSTGGDANSIVGDLESECGTNYVDTVVTQDAPGGTVADVAILQEADEYLSLKNEDEQRKWFYSQCLAMKLACPDQNRARRILISDLYCQVRKAGVPMQQWKQWIKQQMPDEPEGASSVPIGSTGIGRPSSTSGPCGTRSPIGRADVSVPRGTQDYGSRLGAHVQGPGTGGYPASGGGTHFRR